MKFIKDITENENFKGYYLCKKKEEKKTKNNDSYLDIILIDKTDSISSKIWNLDCIISEFSAGDVVQIEAQSELYNNKMQLKILRIRKAAKGEYDPKNYIVSSHRDIIEMKEEFNIIINSIKNINLNQLLNNIFINNPDIMKKFEEHPAAKSNHHGFFGGLIEHTISVASICDFLSNRYNGVNRDLLVTAALLHDIGKLYELNSYPEIEYTNKGKLLGHIVIGYELVSKEIGNILNFDSNLKEDLLHCILSHHGDLEFGSPVVPKTIEAIILSCADRTDAHTKQFEEMIAKIKPEEEWSGYNYIIKREIKKSII